MKTFKRIASFTLALALCFSLCAAVLPAEALAASDTVGSGICSDDLTWVLNRSGTLTISGSGYMADFGPGTQIGADTYAAPWYYLRSKIKNVVIEYGAKDIGMNAFYGCYKLASVTIPSSVASICYEAFGECSSLKNVYYSGTASERNKISIDDYNTYLTGAAWYYGDGSQTYNPYADLPVNSTFEMGYYGGQTLRWRVLEKYSDKMLVLCEDGIDSRRYHYTKESVTWATCSLRTWLNDTFYYSAFSCSERSYILNTCVDSTYCKLYLLSTAEVLDYFPTKTSRICRATTYAVSEGAYVNSDTGGSWWLLRTPGDDYLHVASVNSDGSMDYAGGRVESDKGVVRPAMWISLT